MFESQLNRVDEKDGRVAYTALKAPLALALALALAFASPPILVCVSFTTCVTVTVCLIVVVLVTSSRVAFIEPEFALGVCTRLNTQVLVPGMVIWTVTV